MTNQDAALFNRRAHDADVDAILADLFKSCLAKPVRGPRAFFAPPLGDIRKAVEGIVKAASGDWAKILAEIAALLKSHGVANAEEAARRACAIAQKD